MIYYFSEKNIRGNHAGTKARNDVEAILTEYDARPINKRSFELRVDGTERICSNMKNRLDVLKYFMDVAFLKNKTILIQYPMLAFDADYQYVNFIAKNNRVVFLVHDIQSLRGNNYQFLEKEIKMLNTASALIVHNQRMEDAIRDLGVTVNKYFHLKCFDYLYTGSIGKTQGDHVVFAGNLEKSVFLHKLIALENGVQFDLFGPGLPEEIEMKSGAHYLGSFPPDVIPGVIGGKYGLVWDGDDLIGCTGAVGEYTKINHPHKLSLYAAAGLPVIVWKKAAAAELVKRYQIGILLDRIDNLAEELDDITPCQYDEMKKNVLDLRERVIHGKFLKDVLMAVEKWS